MHMVEPITIALKLNVFLSFRIHAMSFATVPMPGERRTSLSKRRTLSETGWAGRHRNRRQLESGFDFIFETDNVNVVVGVGVVEFKTY